MSSTAPASQIHLRTPPEPGKKPAIRTYLIYFVTGNPGLVEYYRTFLTHLYGVLTHNTASDRSIEFQVYGRSLSGFEMNDAEIKTMKWRKQPPYGLQDQIRHSEDELAELVEEVKESGGARDVRVILVGHSVGSYICLEIIRRLRAHGMVGEDFETRVVGAVGLFPTVVDIARSESGMKASVSTFFLLFCWRFGSLLRGSPFSTRTWAGIPDGYNPSPSRGNFPYGMVDYCGNHEWLVALRLRGWVLLQAHLRTVSKVQVCFRTC